MSDLIFVSNAVLPLFVVIWVGNIVKKLGMLSNNTISQLNALCFKVLLPCHLFRTIAATDVKTEFNTELISFLVFSFVVSTILLCYIVPMFIKSRAQTGSFVQSVFRSNMVLLGMPLIENLFGPSSVSQMGIAISVMVPIFNILAVIVLSHFSERADASPGPIQMLKDIATNPYIIASVLGIFFSFTGLELPVILSRPIRNLADAATPLAMLCLGAHFTFQSAGHNIKINLSACFLKLVAAPALFTTLGALMGMDSIELGVIFICHASPTAVSTVIMSENMGCDGELSGEICLFATALSVFTLFGGSLILRLIGVIA